MILTIGRRSCEWRNARGVGTTGGADMSIGARHAGNYCGGFMTDRPTKAECIDIVLKYFPHCPTKDVAFMCSVTEQRIQQYARELNLRKTPARREAAPYTRFERYV